MAPVSDSSRTKPGGRVTLAYGWVRSIAFLPWPGELSFGGGKSSRGSEKISIAKGVQGPLGSSGIDTFGALCFHPHQSDAVVLVKWQHRTRIFRNKPNLVFGELFD